MDVFSLSWRQGDRKMLQNSCQEKERSEKTLNADTIGHSQRRGCTFPVPDAKGWCKKQQKSSGFKRIVIKNSSIKIFRHGLPKVDLRRAAAVLGCRQLSTIPVDNLVY
jgi:hypothetical protein